MRSFIIAAAVAALAFATTASAGTATHSVTHTLCGRGVCKHVATEKLCQHGHCHITHNVTVRKQ